MSPALKGRKRSRHLGAASQLERGQLRVDSSRCDTKEFGLFAKLAGRAERDYSKIIRLDWLTGRGRCVLKVKREETGV